MEKQKAIFDGGTEGINLPVFLSSLQYQLFEWLQAQIATLYFWSLNRPSLVGIIDSVDDLTVDKLGAVTSYLEDQKRAAQMQAATRATLQNTARFHLNVDGQTASWPLSFSVGWPVNDTTGEPLVQFYNVRFR